MNLVTLFKIDRLVKIAKEKIRMDYIEVINSECEGCFDSEVVRGSVWLIISISCCFYSFFLFDTLGASEGVYGAYWVVIVMLLVPLFVYVIYRIIVRVWKNLKKKSVHGNKSDNNNIYRNSRVELVTIGNPVLSTCITNFEENDIYNL